MTRNKFKKINKQLDKELKKLKKFCKYIKRVFKFEEIVKAQRDLRQKRNYETSIIFIIVFWAFVFRVKSFNKLDEMLICGCFNPLFPRKTKMPSIDTVGRILAKWDIEALTRSFERIIYTLVSNKNFKNGTIDGYTVCAIDETDIVHTSDKKCPNCIYMKISDGYYYAHKAVVAMIIGREINYVLNETFLNVKNEDNVIDRKTYEDKVVTKSEGELTGAMKLLPMIPDWVDVIVADALYFNAPFVKGVLKNSKQAVIRLKD